MSSENIIPLKADDCLAFEDQGYGNAMQHFITKASDFEVFHFGKDYEEDLYLAHLNYKTGDWIAGRLVGEAYFNYDGQKYKISVNPRFGDEHLFRMLEEIFNVRLTESNHAYDKSKSKQNLIRKLISFLWLNLLSKGNRHGLPRITKQKTYYGRKIRGRINVRESLIPLKNEQKMVSTYRQKEFDDRIVQLLKGAYEILLSDYHLGEMKQPHNAKHALDQLNQTSQPVQRLTKRQYKRIIIKRIYKPFKPVIDLSWDIIRNNREADQRKGTEQSFSYFIDMAEIWEMYLRSLLKKRLSVHGWQLREENITTYQGKRFQKNLIPDIVFQRDDRFLVFDAKYKMMKFQPWDFDRSDFFQIHTYIQYFQQHFKNSKVVAGGLLYPLSANFSQDIQNQNSSNGLFSNDGGGTKFLVDGIDLSGIGNDDFDIHQQEELFVERLKATILN